MDKCFTVCLMPSRDRYSGLRRSFGKQWDVNGIRYEVPVSGFSAMSLCE